MKRAETTLGGDRRPRRQPRHLARAKILASLLALADQRATITVAAIVQDARVSRHTFYELFEDLDGCMLAAIEDCVKAAQQRLQWSDDAHASWRVRVHDALVELLALLDDTPGLARVCLLLMGSEGAYVTRRRGELIDQLTRAIEEGRAHSRRKPPPLTGEAVVFGALGILGRRLSMVETPPRLLDMSNELMSLIVHPYLGPLAARVELNRPQRHPLPLRPAPTPPAWTGPSLRITWRTTQVLQAIRERPGLSNTQLAQRVGINDHGQISKLLTRLAHSGIIENTGEGQPRGAANAWQLTAQGRALTRSLHPGV